MVWLEGSGSMMGGKVARRVLLGFVGSALVPLLLMASLSWWQVGREVEQQLEERLAWLAKSYALQIYDRVQMLSADLESQARSEAATAVGSSAHWTLETEPQTDSAVARTGAPILRFAMATSEQFSSGARVELRADRDADTLVLRPDTEYFWWGAAREPTLPARAAMLVWERWTEDALLSTLSDLPDLASLGTERGLVTFRAQGVEYRGRVHSVQLRTVHKAPTLQVMVAYPASDFWAAFRRFAGSFPLLVLAALWLILLLSLVQIRRTLVPLRELRRATAELRDGRYDARARVESDDEFEDLADSFNDMAGEISRHLDALTLEGEIDRLVMSSLDESAVAEVLVAKLPQLTGCESARVILRDAAEGESRLFAGPAAQLPAVAVPHAALETLDSDCELDAEALARRMNLSAFGTAPKWLLAAIESGSDRPAWLAVGGTEEQIETLRASGQLRRFADHAAVALSNSRLVRELDELSTGSLTALARAIDAKSPWTSGHSERVAQLSRELGEQLGLPEAELQTLFRGGLVHDVGKIGVPSPVLEKKGALTAEEWEQMKQHPSLGVRIIEPIRRLQDLIPIVAEHHEFFDGSGYPAGLAGEEISFHGRIAAVADAFDAISSPRPYRAGCHASKAFEILSRDAGTQFDPRVVDALGLVLVGKRLLAAQVASG